MSEIALRPQPDFFGEKSGEFRVRNDIFQREIEAIHAREEQQHLRGLDYYTAQNFHSHRYPPQFRSFADNIAAMALTEMAVHPSNNTAIGSNGLLVPSPSQL
ncbi:hypothetical protein QO002_005713 [Pararhizobium capsulatum DSM 1112]|uniref:Uncharacterized protein n=1 Tax=Pararhizobium capsulatum DSM 1112 TaxID=1121113 RepID=A0ABU0BZX5_9HYPH|nr:hypothetical protein [Pararhizobium capsulatum]MDQ0323507.1 hypothetical protein [Pararhizobium capsulatum DSM 1112]